MTTTFMIEDLVARVAPVLHEYAADGEAQRRLAPEAMAALLDAGLFEVWTPRAYGGMEMDPVSALRLFEALARIDSAAGWIVGNCTGIGTIAEVLPEAGGAELFADPRAVCAGALFPPGTAERVQGGYRISGRWPFGSASSYATWLTGQAIITEQGTPVPGPDGQPAALLFFARGEEARIFDGTWQTLGMRATGSYDYGVSDVFVPDHRVWVFGPAEVSNPAFAGPLYRMGFWLAPPQIATVPLGIAQAALDDFLQLAATKTPAYLRTGLADKPVVQDRIARARAHVDAARRTLHGATAEAWEYVQSGAPLDMEHGIPLALASAFVIEAACTAVDLVHSVAGTTAIREGQRFEQYFRDVHTLSQHALATPHGRYESLGKLLLGRESDWVLYYL